ncbi:MAG: FAD-dependent monooxygenase [Pseudomonadota bacterium]
MTGSPSAALQGCKALIVGAGIGGLSTALALARLGAQVELFEQSETLTGAGAGIQLSPNATRVLYYLGLEEALAAVAFRPEGIEFRHFSSGRVISASALGKAATARYGFPYLHVHRGDLYAVLLRAAQAQPGVRIHAGTRIETVSQNATATWLRIAGQKVTGDLLIGADGIRSMVREKLWGPAAPRFTGNVAWRALVPQERLRAELIRPMSTAWWGPGGHFVHYYVRGGALVNCVCVIEKLGWEVESWTEPGARAELLADFSGWHDSLQQLMHAAEPQSLFKWALFDRDPLPRWSCGRISLLGDACHPTLPFMAQGAAMAIEDAAVLASALAQGDAVERALECYEALRRPRTASIQQGSRRNARVFHLTGVRAWLRDRAVRVAGARTMDKLYDYDALNAVGPR